MIQWVEYYEQSLPQEYVLFEYEERFLCQFMSDGHLDTLQGVLKDHSVDVFQSVYTQST